MNWEGGGTIWGRREFQLLRTEARKGVRFNSTRRLNMPSFTFEKISPSMPPTMAVSNVPAVAKPRGVIVQLLDRLTETRLKRNVNAIEPPASFTEHDISPDRTRS
jgi:hypothetical protein